MRNPSLPRVFLLEIHLRSQLPFIDLVDNILAGKKAGEDTLSQRTRKANSMKCSFVSIVFGS
jgi:hypothetical protein